MEHANIDYSANNIHHINPETAGIVAAIFGGFMLFFVIIILLVYIFKAICLMKIAHKTNTPNAWLAWIPVADAVLMLQIAKKPVWWIVLAFIPFVNLAWIVLAVIVWMSIAEKVRKPEWWGILTIIPIANLVAYGYLAFSKDEDTPAQPTNPAPPIQPAV